MTILHDRDASQLLVVDLQQRFLPHLHEPDAAIAAVVKLVAAARLFDVPIVVTEQNPAKLGPTVEPVREALGDDYRPIAKQSFSADEHVIAGRPQTVICGIETHVCVLQTALELVGSDLMATVVADACTSRDAANHSAAIPRLMTGGVTVATSEMVFFEWCRTADDPSFRELSRIVRQ